MDSSPQTDRRTLSRAVGAFFDELTLWGVRDVVISPGSRSTPLAMVAYELCRREPERLSLTIDIDERGAAFYALGVAKATGRPVAFICTSGTAPGNAYPAVMEADGARVPLIVLSGDRPLRLQGLGAPQTVDQLKLYGDRVRAFRQMPLPAADVATIALFRQAAREACLAALGVRDGSTPDSSPQIASRGCAEIAGPVQLNFPFEEPLVADLGLDDLFTACRAPIPGGVLEIEAVLTDAARRRCEELFDEGRTLILAGEGTCETAAQAQTVIAFARTWGFPIIADPLSGLRSFDDKVVIDAYDRLFSRPDHPVADTVIRFGRYPVSKAATRAMAAARPRQIVVDRAETRDFNAGTDLFVPMAPFEFVRSFEPGAATERQRTFLREWVTLNAEARAELDDLADRGIAVEGAFVRRLVAAVPDWSLVFSANSMAIRALDGFYGKGKPLALMANRALNGIDGTLSTAIGAAAAFEQTTLLCGDLAMLHDLNALALQRELLGRPDPPAITIVLFNNHGGAIFDMLPQASDDPYFERLFLTPETADFASAAATFGIPFAKADTPDDLEAALREAFGRGGISLIEVELPLRGIRERYGLA